MAKKKKDVLFPVEEIQIVFNGDKTRLNIFIINSLPEADPGLFVGGVALLRNGVIDW